MKAMLLGSAAAAALALAACTQQRLPDAAEMNGASAQLPSEEESRAYIESREKQWAALATARNPQVLETILADDYSGVADDGTVRNKAEEIEYWNRLPLAVSAEPPKTAYRRHGDTVIFQGDQLLTPSEGANPIRILWTDVWMHRDGEWRVVASQNATVRPGE